MLNRQLHPVPTATTATAVVASDADSMILADNLRISPDLLFAREGGIFGSGAPGAGKTGIFCRILEQASRFAVPMCIFDQEGDIASATAAFPRGFIGTSGNCPSAKDIVKGGLQVVFQLSSWSDMDTRGSFIARMVNSLYATVDRLPISHRTPIAVGLDESSLFLPQRRGELFSIEIYKQMLDAFHNVAVTGRKRGLVPLLFSQKLSEVSKSVLTPGTYVLLRQSVSTDQKRYLELIEREDIFQYMTERNIMQYIGSLQPGQGIVKLANNEQRIVRFYERETLHTSHAPSVQAALNLYGNQTFNPSASFGADIDGDDGKQRTQSRVTTVASPGKRTGAVPAIRELLEQTPDMKPCEIARLVGCDSSLASRIKRQLLKEKS